MFQKFNLLLLALIILVCRSITSNWPSEFQEVVAWSLAGKTSNSSPKVISPASGDPRFTLAMDNSAETIHDFPLGTKANLLSAVQVKLPENFAVHKFIRFNLQLMLQAHQGNFHFLVKDWQGDEFCQIKLDGAGQVWVSQKVDGLDKMEQVGTITVKEKPMDLLVGVNLESSMVLVKVNGASCRPVHVQSLEQRPSLPGKIGEIGLGFSSPNSPLKALAPLSPGELLHFAIDEAKI